MLPLLIHDCSVCLSRSPWLVLSLFTRHTRRGGTPLPPTMSIPPQLIRVKRKRVEEAPVTFLRQPLLHVWLRQRFSLTETQNSTTPSSGTGAAVIGPTSGEIPEIYSLRR